MKFAQSCPTLCDPTDCTVHGILQARILEWVHFPCPGDLPHPGIEPRSPTLQEDVLTSEPKVSSTLATPWTVARQAPLTIGFSRNTGVSCHFLLQGIFPIQESNSGLLHGRQILNRLSQEGSPSHQGTLLKVFVLALLEEHLLCRRHIIK